MAQNRRRTGVEKKTVRKIVIGVILGVAVVAVAVTYLRRQVTERFGTETASEYLTAQVTRGSVSTTVSGSGTLMDEALEQMTIPGTVELETWYVQDGDVVSAGDPLASVNMTSLVAAMGTVQDEIDALDAQLKADAESDDEQELTATVSGRVKTIYAEEGDSVVSVMAGHGALAILSMDGKLAVEIPADGLAVGDEVVVTTSWDYEYNGTVERVSNGAAVILLTDNGPYAGDTVRVTETQETEDGAMDILLGEGTLYIHEPLAITGYAGTVADLLVEENEYVDAGDALMELSDIEHAADYETLLRQRSELEEEINRLIAIYRDGELLSEYAGVIRSLPTDEKDAEDTTAVNSTAMMRTAADDEPEDQIIEICPNESMYITMNVDETDILSLREGQSAVVTISSLGDETYFGEVTEVHTDAVSGSTGVTYFTAVVRIGKADRMLAGMSASVSVLIEGVEDALLVPADAVQRTSAVSYVFTSVNEETGELGGMRQVTAGVTNGIQTEIREGLSEGETVYYTEKADTGFSFFGAGGASSGPFGQG